MDYKEFASVFAGNDANRSVKSHNSYKISSPTQNTQ